MFSLATALRFSPPRLETPITPMFSFSFGESLRAAASDEAPMTAMAVVLRNWRRSIACRISFSSRRLRAGQFADVNVLEPKIVAVILQLNRAGRVNRFVQPFLCHGIDG